MKDRLAEVGGVILSFILVGGVIGFILWSNYTSPTPPDNSTTTVSSDTTCSPDYDPCVPDVSYDLDCSDVGEEVEVVGYDVYGLDGDNDGWACESY